MCLEASITAQMQLGVRNVNVMRVMLQQFNGPESVVARTRSEARLITDKLINATCEPVNHMLQCTPGFRTVIYQTPVSHDVIG